MLELRHKDKEIEVLIQLKYPLGGTPQIYIEGSGNLLHHLIEGVFSIVDRLARMEGVGHSSKEWRGK